MDFKILVLAMLTSAQALYYDDGVCIYDCNSPRLLTPTMTDTAPVPDMYGAGQCTCDHFGMQDGKDTIRYFSLDFFLLVLAVIISKTKPSRSCKTLVLVHLMCFIPLTTQLNEDERRAPGRAMPYPVATVQNRPNRTNASNRVFGPNPAVVGPNPAVVAPNPVVVEPNPAVVGPNPAVVAPNPVVVEPNPAVVGPNPSGIEPNPDVFEPDQENVEHNLEVAGPSPANIRPPGNVGLNYAYGDMVSDGDSDDSSTRSRNSSTRYSNYESDLSEAEAVYLEMAEMFRRRRNRDGDGDNGPNGLRRHTFERTS